MEEEKKPFPKEQEHNTPREQNREMEQKEQEQQPAINNIDFVHMLHDEFLQKYSGVAGLEDKWNQVRSQINSGLMLGINKTDIRKIFTLEYNYEQREVIKLALFMGIEAKVLKKLTADKTAKEMLLIIENSKLEDTLTGVVTKPIAMLSASFDDFVKETENLRNENNELKEELERLREEINSYKTAKEEMDRQKQIEIKAEQLARLKLEQYKNNMVSSPEPQPQPQPVIINQPKKKWFVPKKEKNENITLKMAASGTLPRNFDISSYLAEADLSTSQLKIINYAINYGLSNNVIVNMVENGYSAEKMQQYVGIAISNLERERHMEGGNQNEF